MPRDRLSQEEKYQGFAKAFATFTRYRDLGNFLSGYVVAFSIFEDRVTACFMLAKDAAGEARPTKYTRHYEKVKFLERQKHIDRDSAVDWLQAGDERNSLLHAAMWNIDAVTDAHCTQAIERARTADRLSRRIKRVVSKNTERSRTPKVGERPQ